MLRASTGLTASVGLLLAVAAAVQFHRSPAPGAETPRPPLRDVLPADLPGWTSQEVPLAETEEGRTAVAGILQYDDYFSRAYRSGATEVSVYVAYWRAGRMPPRFVGRHTPDRCWVLNGWSCERRQRQVLLPGPSGPLKPAETGTYAIGDRTRLEVAFWHLVGGEPYAYGPEQSDMVAMAPLLDLRRFGLNQRQEQFFIRVACNTTLDRVWQDPSLARLVHALEGLGLGVMPPPMAGQVAAGPPAG